MKKTIITVAIFAIISVIVFAVTAGGNSKPVSNNGGSAAPVVEKKHTVTYTAEVTLAKGKSMSLGVDAAGDAQITYKSSDEEIVKVNESGKLSGKDCGVAYVSAEIKNGGFDCIYNFKIYVIKNSYMMKAAKTEEDAAATQPVLSYGTLMKTGESIQIITDGLGRKDTVSYSSSDDSVLSVDENGNVKALKEGNAVISSVVNQGDKIYTLKSCVNVYDDIYDYSVTDEQRIEYYKDAAFIGNSIGVGLKSYIENNLGSKIGKPLIMVRGSYAFHNDKSSNHGYMIEYNGTEMKAKDAVKQSGKKKIFINMGTNDLFGGAEKATENYIEYVEGIKELSPDVEIFIESTTSATPGKAVKSSNVKILNDNMQKYCEEHEDFYFIDFNQKLIDSNYNLYPKYSTDNYVHLNNSAYEIWMNEVMAFTDKMMVQEQVASEAVETAEATKLPAHIEEAKKLVDDLSTGAVKDGLTERLEALSPETEEE